MRFDALTLVQTALKKRNLIRLTRKGAKGHATGYVVAVGPLHFLLALVGDGVWFDGFECYRIKDLKSLVPDPYSAFVEAALKKRGLGRPKTPMWNAATKNTILESVGATYPLVTLHFEKADPYICYIGRVVRTSRKKVALLQIRPDAIWDKTATVYPLRKITRISFGGSYEEALHLVGGKSGP